MPCPPDLVADAFGWDARNWSAAIDFWESHVELPPGCRALELGCARNGGLGLWLAHRGAHVTATFYGDVTAEMQAIHRKHGVDARVTYVPRIDARDPQVEGPFDLVVFKSLLGMIPEPDRGVAAADRVFAAAHRLLKPGGWILLAENLVGTPLHAALRRRYGAGRVGWYYYVVRELRESLARHFQVVDRTAGFIGCFGLSERQRRLLGGLDRTFLERVVPSTWHYIYFGAGRKPPIT